MRVVIQEMDKGNGKVNMGEWRIIEALTVTDKAVLEISGFHSPWPASFNFYSRLVHPTPTTHSHTHPSIPHTLLLASNCNKYEGHKWLGHRMSRVHRVGGHWLSWLMLPNQCSSPVKVSPKCGITFKNSNHHLAHK